MPTIKYTCPECKASLKPSQPVPEGKKIKCPKCDHLFVASEAVEKPVAEKPAPKPAPKRPAADDDDEGGDPTYTVAATKEGEEDAAKATTKEIFQERMREKFPTSKRGPAQAALTPPSNALLAAGILTCLGYLLWIAVTAWPMLFSETPPKDTAERWFWILVYAVEFILGGFITTGAVKMQNLGYYPWCVASCVVGILPFAMYFTVLTLPTGLWCLMTLRKPDVRGGFSSKKKRKDED